MVYRKGDSSDDLKARSRLFAKNQGNSEILVRYFYRQRLFQWKISTRQYPSVSGKFNVEVPNVLFFLLAESMDSLHLRSAIIVQFKD